MKAIITTTLLMMLITFGLHAQEPAIIRGQICNGLNHMPLKDCHVYVDGQVTGTISNQYGEFELEIPDKYLDRSLYISYVGFETFEQPIREITGNYVQAMLRESPIELEEIVITPGHTGIIQNALASVKDNFDDEEDLMQAFYKVLLEKDEDQHILKRVLASNKTE